MAINGFRADGEVYRYNASALEGDVTIPDGSVTLDSLASGVIDDTLAVDGAAADAKATGDAITALNDGFANLGTFNVITASVNSSGYTDIPYPSGFSAANTVILGASIYTRYNSWVDFTYDTFTYGGDLLFTASGVRFTPKSAGYATQIRIVLWHS